MTNYHPKNLLVTGGAGFIGSNYIRCVISQNPDITIVNLDSLTYSGSLHNLANLPGEDQHIFVEGSITDQDLVESLFRKYGFDGVVNFAAESHVDRSILGPKDFIETNIIGTFTLLEVARKLVLEEKYISKENFRFHHISTDEVYGTLLPSEPPFTEVTPYTPNSPYAATKASSDHIVRSYYHTYGLPILITNSSNNYGPYQYPEKLVPLMISNALSGNPLPIYGDGKQIRDWLYVTDHCEALWLVLNKGKQGETYLIGGDNQPTNIEIVNIICSLLEILKPRSGDGKYVDLIQYVPDRPGHDRRYQVDCRKIGQEIGWKPKEALETGLEKTVKWYVDNQDWISKITDSNTYQSWIKKSYET